MINYDNPINRKEKATQVLWLIKIWGGSGYFTTPFVVWAEDEEDAINRVFNYGKEHHPSLFLTWQQVKENLDIKGTPTSAEFETIEENYVNGDGWTFARRENFFCAEVPRKYLSNSIYVDKHAKN